MSGAEGGQRPGLVVVSPLPPTRSGIAAYTAELVPALAPLIPGGITVVVAREDQVVPLDGARVLAERAYRRDPALERVPHLLQLGNSLDHAHVHRAALRRPGGIVVLHEVVLHHLVEALTLGRGSPHAYEAALAHSHGPAGRRLARLRRAGLFSPWQRFLMPLHREVLEAAGGVILHSRYAAGRLQGPPDLPVRILPHHLSPAVARHDALGRAEARALLGLPPDGPVLLLLGHVTPPKQAPVVLQALAALPGPWHLVPWHLVIGGAVEPGLDLAAMAEALGIGGRVRLTGWLAEEAFFQHLRAADLLLALRFPSAGETSGTLVRALGMGTPALVHDFGPAAEFPDGVVAKLPVRTGDAAAPALAEAIGRLLADPGALAAMGRAARAHVRRAHRLEASAAAYAAAVRDWADR